MSLANLQNTKLKYIKKNLTKEVKDLYSEKLRQSRKNLDRGQDGGGVGGHARPLPQTQQKSTSTEEMTRTEQQPIAGRGT